MDADAQRFHEMMIIVELSLKIRKPIRCINLGIASFQPEHQHSSSRLLFTAYVYVYEKNFVFF